MLPICADFDLPMNKDKRNLFVGDHKENISQSKFFFQRRRLPRILSDDGYLSYFSGIQTAVADQRYPPHPDAHWRMVAETE